ncbi:DUF3293 domain-containing protein [Luteimonas huabeiensis]|uniref:DUF3293 domain-containing protein n=1 Tax=Luteimonas huabeiensis TaxID=1244513 RepID=UPI0004635BFA|nr:DUF3293 domain-containing protein [Luteimonas huabeiensis]
MGDHDHAHAAALLDAYLHARYAVQAGGRWRALRIGAPPPSALLRALPGATRFGVITAWNPGSVPCDARRNAAADRRLRAALDALSPVAPLRTRACAPDGGWQEPGWLVPGLEAATLDALARRFGQLGTLHWAAGGPVRLRMDAAPPPGAAERSPYVDWLRDFRAQRAPATA